MDETFLGGKPRKGKDKNIKRSRASEKKVPIVSMAERDGKIKAKPVKRGKLNATSLSMLVRRNIDLENSTLVTDKYRGYMYMKNIIDHRVVDHSIWYVDGELHTNSVESFWALLKRGIIGQFHKVSIKHLPKYIDEFCYHFNHREDSASLFDLTILRGLNIVGPEIA